MGQPREHVDLAREALGAVVVCAGDDLDGHRVAGDRVVGAEHRARTAATDRLLIQKEGFDVVVLDIMLPGKDGFSVVSELRAARNYVDPARRFGEGTCPASYSRRSVVGSP